MEDIYSQGELERNSIVAVPEGYARDAGNTLYSWLGSIWRDLNRGDDMVRGLQSARGIRLAQLYVDAMEAAMLKDRFGAPVFHRELWHPIVIRYSERDKAQENLLKIGIDGEIGPQPAGSRYGEGTVFAMGRMANFEDFVTYPIDSSIVGGARQIVDNIINPAAALESGSDFEIHGSTIVFPKDMDPLADGSPFEKYDVPLNDPEDPDAHDIEAVIWASNVLFDWNYISDHLSYALGADAPSSDVVKRVLNAIWSSFASGLTPELVKTAMAAMLNIPVVQGESETIVDITRDRSRGGELVVRTDKGTYRMSPKARLRKGVRSGATLKRGDLFDESLRIYPFLNAYGKADGTDFGFSVPLEQDVPSVVISPAMLRVKTEFGVYTTWPESVVKRYDSPEHLYFDVGGTESDVMAFWNDIWNHARESGVKMSDLIGPEGSTVSPAEFMIRNLVGANTMFVVVDRSQLDDTALMREPMFFDMLTKVVPSAIRLFLVEHVPVGDEDIKDMGDSREGEFLAAALPKKVDCVCEGGMPGLSGRGPAFGESVRFRFVRPMPVKVRARREQK